MAGKERDLRIAADFLCSWKLSGTTENLEESKCPPSPLLLQAGGLGASAVKPPVFSFGWEEPAAPTGKRWEPSTRHLPPSPSCDTPELGLPGRACFRS